MASTPSSEMLLLRARWPLKLIPLPWPLTCCPVTPATWVEKLRKSRPLLGRFSISVRDTTAPVCVRPRSMTGAAAVTVTSWLMPPGCSEKSKVNTWPTSRERPVRCTVVKPSSDTVSLYAPAGTAGMRYRPVWLVTVVRSTPVSTLVSTSVAPGSTPPVTSRTMPSKSPATAVCAWTGIAAKHERARKRRMPVLTGASR